MMAGAGVSISGVGMLRARRRDVSVKPNRKLDRKSSRGMIYENEELRLRTININAEVEQGQNDIKKLRKENEQLRHEIWSLRDEYDKLEEILKSQKNREDSEDYEDHSETEEKNDDDEAEERSDYSDEEAEEDCDGKEKECTEHYEREAGNEANKEERLENAENQKISSEKMSSSNHRLHVEFDDLSVVDEEDELKKDKELRDTMSPGKKEGDKNAKEIDRSCDKPQNGYQYLSPTCGPPGASVFANSYYPEQSFIYPNPERTEFREILPIDPSSMLHNQCASLGNDAFPRMANYEQLGVPNVPSDHDDQFRRRQMTYGYQIGWQNDIFMPNMGFQSSGNPEVNVTTAQVSAMSPALGFESPGQSNQSVRSMSTVRAGSLPRRAIDDRIDSSGKIAEEFLNAAIIPGVSQRRNLLTRQPDHYTENIVPNRAGSAKTEGLPSAEALTCNGWDFGNAKILCNANDCRVAREEHRERSRIRETTVESENHRRLDHSSIPVDDRPKHFFAPLPANIQHARPESDDKMSTGVANNIDVFSSGFLESFGTGKSSSSDRTNSTIISARHFQPCSQQASTLSQFFTDNGAKGPADVCVNGGVATNANDQVDHRSNDERNCKSSENLFIEDRGKSRANSSSRHGSNNPLVKSVSCQDLTSEQVQNSLFEMTRSFQTDGKCQKLAKSDNTLDNPVIGTAKPFRSQLNVTLKLPCNSGYDNVRINRTERERYSPGTPEIPKLPTIDYRLFNNPFLKTFDARGGIYGNHDTANPGARPLAIQANENSLERDKMLQWHQPSIGYSSAALTQSFARRLNPDESAIKQARAYGTTINEIESDRQPISLSATTCRRSPTNDPRVIGNPVKQRQDFQVTSFEAPNPRSLRPGLTAYDIDPMRILSAPTTLHPPISNYPKLYQNVPFVPGASGMFCSGSQNTMRMFYENQAQKVPAQTQTSIDDGSSRENDTTEEIRQNAKTSGTENRSAPGSPDSTNSTRRKRIVRKERVSVKTGNRSLSPAAQRRRLRKQSSLDDVDVPIERNKTGNKTRQLSPAMTNTTTTTTSDHMEEKNESRSSSSGQESPRKEHNRKVSMYFNSKKRPSIESVRTRSFSVNNGRDNFSSRNGGDTLEATNSDRERTNSASSREAVARNKTRKSSISSGKLPWCSCWGNGCV